MQLSALQVESENLATLAAEAVQLLVVSKFSGLAEKFGYAVAIGRHPAAAIQEDLRSSLSLPDEQLVQSADPKVRVKYFDTNSLNLYAVAECTIATSTGRGVLVELVVFNAGDEFHATLEQISAEA